MNSSIFHFSGWKGADAEPMLWHMEQVELNVFEHIALVHVTNTSAKQERPIRRLRIARVRCAGIAALRFPLLIEPVHWLPWAPPSLIHEPEGCCCSAFRTASHSCTQRTNGECCAAHQQGGQSGRHQGNSVKCLYVCMCFCFSIL